MSKCEQCGRQTATVHITQITNNETTVSHLCETCARAKGFAVEIKNEVSLFLPEMAVKSTTEAVDTRECSHCHLLFSEFLTKGLLGCSACYEEFQPDIDALLLTMHGTAVYKGKRSAAHAAGEFADADVNSLSARLADAIQREEYEQAALLRDKIRLLIGKEASLR
jgi:protein arginine kinase activator